MAADLLPPASAAFTSLSSQIHTVERTFKQFDADKSGQVSFKEFRQAMERFGLHVSGETPGMGGVPLDVLQAS